MAKLIWLALLVFCLVAVQAKKHEKAPAVESASQDEPKPEEEQPEGGDEQAGGDQEEASEATDATTPTADADDTKQADAKSETQDDTTDSAAASDDEKQEDANEPDQKSEDEADDSESEEKKEFACNLKFKKVGCYADKAKTKVKPLKSFIMSDSDMGVLSKKGKLPKEGTFNSELPKFVCKCANEAMKSGNAVFGIQNFAECWSGPDDSKYDKDGKSDNCVAFDYKPCSDDSVVCAGKKHANYVYYVDSPDHTKSSEEIKKELAADAKKKKAEKKKKAAAKKLAKKLSKKKSKKSKKSKQ